MANMKNRVVAVLVMIAVVVAVVVAEGDGDLVAELVKMQEQSAGGVIHLDDASLQRYAATANSRSYSLFIFFDAVQMRDNAELRLQELRAEFQLMAASFIKNNPGITKLFFCDLEFKESQASFVLMGVNSLPQIRLVGPGNANVKDSPAMDMARGGGGTAESMAAFVEGQTGLRVGEIERPSPVSKKQLLFVGGVVLVAAPYVVKRLLTQQTPLHDPKLWLAFSIFVYFFSVSGAMYNIIRKMPLFMADRNDPSKLVFFFQGSGMQLGAEGFAVGFLYTVVGLVLAFVTHFLVYVRSQNMQRLLMLLAMALSFWAVKRVISLDNWKTGYAIHGFWPSASS